MTTNRNDAATATILDSIGGTRDALSVRRVFGDAYEIDGTTIIPVARIAGGAGGGGGEGPGGSDGEDTGSGFGTGFGVRAQPVGVYKVRDGEVEWKPIVDVTRLAHGGQVLGGIVAVCLTLVALRRVGARH
jgi:uncharacterized spore protein YtfJ